MPNRSPRHERARNRWSTQANGTSNNRTSNKREKNEAITTCLANHPYGSEAQKRCLQKVDKDFGKTN